MAHSFRVQGLLEDDVEVHLGLCKVYGIGLRSLPMIPRFFNADMESFWGVPLFIFYRGLRSVGA